MAQLELFTESPPKPPELRHYQLKVIYDLYAHIRSGEKRVLCVAATGSGKTIIAAKIVADAASRGRRVLFLVHLDVLVGQTHDKFSKFGLKCGFIKAGWREDREALIQIASIQTLDRRDWWKDFNPEIILFDEAHVSSFSKTADRIMAQLPDAIYIGLTATPWRLKKTESMADKFNALVLAPLPSELMKMGFLVKPTYYGIPGADLDGVRTTMGDFNEMDLAVKCDVPEVVDRIVKEWQRLAPGRRTIIFAVNINHSQHIAAAFNNAGIQAEHVDGTMTTNQRSEIFGRLERGETLVLSSCNALSVGFDVPAVSAIALCRPTKSKALAVQQLGRGLRICTDKSDCIVLDQAGNVKRHGFVEDLTEEDFQLKPKSEKEKGAAPIKPCPDSEGGCGALLHISIMVCPHCGYKFPEKDEEKVKPLDDMVLMRSKQEKLDKSHKDALQQLSEEDTQKMTFLHKQLKYAYQKLYSPGYALHKYKEKYGTFPNHKWLRGSVFPEISEDSVAEYRYYLSQVARRSFKDEAWIEQEMRQQFGSDYRGRLAICASLSRFAIAQEASRVISLTPPPPPNPATLYPSYSIRELLEQSDKPDYLIDPEEESWDATDDDW